MIMLIIKWRADFKCFSNPTTVKTKAATPLRMPRLFAYIYVSTLRRGGFR